MKNRGFATKRVIPTGDHKTPVNAPLIGQNFAGVVEDKADLPASPPIPKAQEEALRPSETAKNPKPKSKPKQPGSAEATKRYTLILKVDIQLVKHAFVGSTAPTGVEKRNLINEVRKRFIEQDGVIKPNKIATPSTTRIDIVLSDTLVQKVVKRESTAPYEPISTVLGRVVSSYYAEVLAEMTAK